MYTASIFTLGVDRFTISDMPTSKTKSGMATRIVQLMDGPPKTTSEKLGEALGVTPGAITKWRKGGQIRDEHKVGLARYFNISIDWLLTGVGAGPDNRDRKALAEQMLALSDARARQLQTIVDALAVPDSDQTPRENHN